MDSRWIVVVGAGSVGSTVVEGLVRSGYRRVKIIDLDIVSRTSLDRSPVYTLSDINLFKVEALRRHIYSVDPTAEIRLYPYMLTENNFTRVFRDASLVIDTSNTRDTTELVLHGAGSLGIPVLSLVGGEEGYRVLMNTGSRQDVEQVYNGLEGQPSIARVFQMASEALEKVGGRLGKRVHRYPRPEGSFRYMGIDDTFFFTPDERVSIDIEGLTREVARRYILLRRGDVGLVFEVDRDVIAGVTYAGGLMVKGGDLDMAEDLARNLVDDVIYKYVVE